MKKDSRKLSFFVPRAGAKMLVIDGDYCVFIGGYKGFEPQLVTTLIEAIKTIPEKCGQNVVKNQGHRRRPVQ